MKFAKKQKCLILEWLYLPEYIKEIIAEWYNFGKDILIEVSREFDIESYKKGKSSLEEYYQDQVNTNGFIGSLEDFIEEYNLEFDVWFIEQEFDLNDIDTVLIEVYW